MKEERRKKKNETLCFIKETPVYFNTIFQPIIILSVCHLCIFINKKKHSFIRETSAQQEKKRSLIITYVGKWNRFVQKKKKRKERKYQINHKKH